MSVEVSKKNVLFQWLTEDGSYKLDNEKLQNLEYEIADVLIYLLRLSYKFGVDPISAAKEKIEIRKDIQLIKIGSSKKYEY